MKLGSFPVVNEDKAIEEAIQIAQNVETAVLVVGLNQDWESESYDRPTLSLPLRTEELIDRIADSCQSTRIVVVIQAGSAVSMPWLAKVDAVVYAWYGGNESGNAIADILYGHCNPSGRLSLTLPKRERDIAAHLTSKSTRRRIAYDEGIWMGYRHFNARDIEPLFPFGHGLSYTTFSYSDLQITSMKGTSANDWTLEAQVTVTNSGEVPGSHSAHFYLTPPDRPSTSLLHPEVTLQAFGKTGELSPGVSEVIQVTLDKCKHNHIA